MVAGAVHRYRIVGAFVVLGALGVRPPHAAGLFCPWAGCWLLSCSRLFHWLELAAGRLIPAKGTPAVPKGNWFVWAYDWPCPFVIFDGSSAHTDCAGIM